MINFFRRIRKNMLAQNKFAKYLTYALGEIFLVVIGILIALQINNWNEEKIQEQDLNDILHSVANGVQSDLRELNLVSAARINIKIKSDSIFNTYSQPDKQTLNIEEASYIHLAFQNILNTVHLNTNLSAFESLKSSMYFSKIQGTDLALLLSTYYSSADKLRNLEDVHNQSLKNLEQGWQSHFRNKGEVLFMQYWEAGDFAIAGPLFLAVLRDQHTVNIFEKGYNEGNAIQIYRDQILMGKKLVEMIRDSKSVFDQQTKLELSGILFSIGDADIVSVLINGGSPIGFDIKYAASNVFNKHFSSEKDYLTIQYPPNTYDWGSLYFSVDALDGRVNEMDFSPYTKMVIEMRGEAGGEVFEIAMKDVSDPPDGTESRVKIQLTEHWKLYEIETKQFVTADMNRIMVPLAFVFEDSKGLKINVRSIQFKKD